VSSGVWARAVEEVSVAVVRARCSGGPHQGVLLRDARLPGICPRCAERMVRSGHDPQGLNQFVDVAVLVGVMPIPSSLGVVSELHATARGWRQRISPSRRP
jgi:hypothetical protein